MEIRDRCCCGAVQGLFDDEEYPCIRQGVMHSPVGCMRREMSEDDLRELYRELTGHNFEGTNRAALFQAVMAVLSRAPVVAKVLGCTLTVVPCHPARSYEEPANGTASRRRVYEGAPHPRSQPQPPPAWDPSTGRIKPPWEK